MLQFLPRVTKFIQKAIDNNDNDDNNSKNDTGIVYVHCVHGQSRSCAVCVAYLMHQYMLHNNEADLRMMQFLDWDFSANCDNKCNVKHHHDMKQSQQLLHISYNYVMKSRPQMAINPGFVKQLEIFRQMKVAHAHAHAQGTLQNDKYRVNFKGERKENLFLEKEKISSSPPIIQSRAHAYFRSFRSKSEFYYSGHITSNFSPLVVQIPAPVSQENTSRTTIQGNDKKNIARNDAESRIILYQCQNCHESLFTTMNIIQEWTEEQVSSLPISDYWRESQGGLEYMNFISSNNSLNEKGDRNNQNDLFGKVLSSQTIQILKLEPMAWMKKDFFHNDTSCSSSNINSSGSLYCPNCTTHLGYWDWLNTLDLPTACIVLRNKVFEREIT